MGGADERRGTMSAPNFCPDCGNELGDPGIYCSRCGMRCREGASPDAAETGARTRRESVDPRGDGDGDGDDPPDRGSSGQEGGTSEGGPPDGESGDPSDGEPEGSPGGEPGDPSGGEPGDPPAEGSESGDGESKSGDEQAGNRRWVSDDERSATGRSGDGPGEAAEGRPGGPVGPRDREEPYGESPEEFGERVRDHVVAGWELERNHGDRVVLVDRDYGTFAGHVAVFLLTGWFTLGLGNVAYAVYSHQSDPDRMVLRRGGRPRGRDGDPRREERDSTAKLLVGAGLLLLGGLTLVTGSGAEAVAAGLFAALAGLAVFPPTRRRLGDRRPITTFGRSRGTTERPVVAPETPCTICSAPVGRGVERTYREDVVFAGVTLFTAEEGTNHYCRACAAGDVPPTEGERATPATGEAAVGGEATAGGAARESFERSTE